MKIELTAHEIEMVALLEPFTISLDEPYELKDRKLKLNGNLMQSLLERNVIPKSGLNILPYQNTI